MADLGVMEDEKKVEHTESLQDERDIRVGNN
jgi:hypothetical protein